ncbi:MAG: class I SAM-dependent methyltransferase [Patescibacteria group bacterium]|nr:class I SAM-dependent methyltransferase [Patescibacteria group bacterium]
MIKNNLLNIESLIARLGLEQGFRVADLGCGAFGYFTFLLAKFVGKSGKIYAVDIIKDSLEAIKKRARIENLSQIETIWSDLEVVGGANIKSDSLDSVLLINVLHQSEKKINILKECMRILKPGGKVLLVEWNEKDSPFILSSVNKVSRDEIKRLSSFLNIKIEDEFQAGEYHYGMLLSK